MNLKKYILNDTGYFGEYGGCYVPEVLIPIMQELSDAFYSAKNDPVFEEELKALYRDFAGRPTPLIHCKNVSKHLGTQVYLKNEGLLHTGAHKINHCLGQILLAKRLGKKRIIAETGAGQHGLATATVAAKFGMEATIYMGAKDYARQRPNVFYMERLGAKVIPVTHGGQILRDAITEAIRDLISSPEETHYLLGTACGPHPYPAMNVYFQKVIGDEMREQFQAMTGKLPDYLVAAVGGGSNALGLFHAFLDDASVNMRIIEAGGKGITAKNNKQMHAARFQKGSPAVVEGMKSLFLQDENGQIQETHSISAGLDYSGVSPQLAHLESIGRVEADYATDDEVLKAYELFAQKEGIIGALESSHAFAGAISLSKDLPEDATIIINCSGRGDKDLFITAPEFDREGFTTFLSDYLTRI